MHEQYLKACQDVICAESPLCKTKLVIAWSLASGTEPI